MEEFNMMRHGYKLKPGEERGPIEQSELTPEEQETWTEAVERLRLYDDPEITYETLKLIKQLASKIYDELPEKATLIFASTQYPRAKLTADFLSTELSKLLIERKEKDIGVAYLWEPMKEGEIENKVPDVMDFSSGYKGIWPLMREVGKEDAERDPTLREYLDQKDGNKSHPGENELTRKAINVDLVNPHSIFRTHIPILREQLRKCADKLKGDQPIYFYGVGHHSNLIALDVAINGTTHYDSVEQMPEPLAIWKADRTAIDRFLNSDE